MSSSPPNENNNNNKTLTKAKTLLSTAASFATTVMLFRTFIQDFLPHEINNAMFSNIKDFLTRLLTNHFTLVIEQYDGLVKNELFESALIYVRPKVDPKSRRLKITKPEKETNYTLTMFSGDEFVDVFKGEKFKWVWFCEKSNARENYGHMSYSSYQMSEKRSFQLTFHKKNKELAVNSYLPYVAKQAQVMKQENRTVKILTLENYHRDLEMESIWKPVILDHPATFATLAMDLEVKEMVLSDLDRFIERREYYKEVGKAWKRGYLLYGPPGTGKSSLVAAIANYLRFDVYDLQLSTLHNDSDLRRVLLGTANKSILVVEDIDCTIDVQEQLGNRSASYAAYDGYYGFGTHAQRKVTLSGLLNFVDGLWSSCGDERIIIFTTNKVEKLDPALLRPGRMDVHINLSYCTPCGFKLLASNYLGIEEHVMFHEIEGLIPVAKVTPAEVAEQLLKNDDPDVSLGGLIAFMHKKIKENEEAEAAEKLKQMRRLGRTAESGEVLLLGESADSPMCVQQGNVEDTQARAMIKIASP